MSKLIVMLTYRDETVLNAKEVFALCKDLPIEFWGFKNIGLPLPKMKDLVNDMKEAGKVTFLEVVTLEEKECIEGAHMAVECGFDYLLGTVYYPSVHEYAQQHHLKYLPFCGTISGHPSILHGSDEEIINDALRLESLKVDGTDLLAYRHKNDPKALIKKLVHTLTMPVIVAGSVGSFERIDVVNSLNPWAFTIGTALFDGEFTNDFAIKAQLEAVIQHINLKEGM